MLGMMKRAQYDFSIKRFYLWAGEDTGSDDGGTSGGAEGDGGAAGATVTEVGASGPVPALDWGAVIPEDLRDKEHFKNVLKAEDPGAELVKQFDNAQKLIGKKSAGVPAPDASDEEWEKFYESARPKDGADYDFKKMEGTEENKALVEYINKQRGDEYFTDLKAAARELGLTKRQAEGLQAKIDQMSLKYSGAAIKTQLDAEAALETHFQDLLKKNFNGKEKAAVAYGKEFIKQFAEEGTQKYVDGLPNEALIIIASMGQGVIKKYEKEDTILGAAGTVDISTMSETEAQNELDRVLRDPAYSNPMDAKHSVVRERASEASKQVVAARKGVKK